MWKFKNRSERDAVFGFLLFISVVFFSNYLCPDELFAENNSLICYYQLNNNLQDSADEHHGTFSGGSPVYVEGILGKALKLDGRDDYVSFSNKFILHQPTDATISFWIRRDTDTTHRAVFWTRPDIMDKDRFNIFVHNDEKSSFGFDYRAPNGTFHPILHPGTVALPKGTWHHLAIKRAGNTYQVYKNGTFITKVTDPSPDLPTSVGWTIAGRAGFCFDGSIDELKIWSRALSDQEIKDEYDSAITPPPSSTPPSPPSIPQLMRFQARLTDAEGEAVSGEHSITFSLYDSQTEGEPLWSETQTDVSVDSGIVDVVLGSVNPIDLPFDKQYWLAIKIDTDEEMSPRIMLTTAPYSFRAKE